MNISLSRKSGAGGFTLVELMVAMAITLIIVSILIPISSMALDVWNRSRAELRASRQAKAMIEAFTKDFESMVIRKGNTNEWLYAMADTGEDGAASSPGGNLTSSNSAQLAFFTASTDRYDGNIGDSEDDKGGDVSAVIYKLAWVNTINQGDVTNFPTYILKRQLVNPDDTFANLLGKPDLAAADVNVLDDRAEDEPHFVCEGIYQFTLTFYVEVDHVPSTGATEKKTIPVVLSINGGGSGPLTDRFRIKGNGIETSFTGTLASPSPGSTMGVTRKEIQAGRVTSVGISLTVLADKAVDQIRRRTIGNSERAAFLAKNSFQYSKVIQVPAP